MITIPKKEYTEVIETQKTILSRLNMLQEIIFESVKDEIDPSRLKRLQEISDDLDNGKSKSKSFSSIYLFKNYLKKL